MKKTLILVLSLFTAACSHLPFDPDKMGTLNPQMVRGDENEVILYDPSGNIRIRDAEIKATNYCSAYGKKAEWKSKGGDYLDCQSNQLNYCVTYACK